VPPPISNLPIPNVHSLNPPQSIPPQQFRHIPATFSSSIFSCFLRLAVLNLYPNPIIFNQLQPVLRLPGNRPKPSAACTRAPPYSENYSPHLKKNLADRPEILFFTHEACVKQSICDPNHSSPQPNPTPHPISQIPAKRFKYRLKPTAIPRKPNTDPNPTKNNPSQYPQIQKQKQLS